MNGTHRRESFRAGQCLTVEGNGRRDATPATDGTLVAMRRRCHDNRPTLNEKPTAMLYPKSRQVGRGQFSQKKAKSIIAGR
jgi:hypothetical protein